MVSKIHVHAGTHTVEHFVSSRAQLHSGSYGIRTQLLDSTQEQWTKRFIADFTICNQPDGSRSFSMDKFVRHITMDLESMEQFGPN